MCIHPFVAWLRLIYSHIVGISSNYCCWSFSIINQPIGCSLMQFCLYLLGRSLSLPWPGQEPNQLSHAVLVCSSQVSAQCCTMICPAPPLSHRVLIYASCCQHCVMRCRWPCKAIRSRPVLRSSQLCSCWDLSCLPPPCLDHDKGGRFNRNSSCLLPL